MSSAFANSLRARGTVRLGAEGQAAITVRVQVAEVWDAVRVQAPPTEPVLAVKVAALEALYPQGEFHEDLVMKLRGFEVLDEHASLADAGAADGSTFLLSYRRRRPVRSGTGAGRG